MTGFASKIGLGATDRCKVNKSPWFSTILIQEISIFAG